ncbi:MAG: hypothetical protein ABI635_02935 [Actinomycetota bacterium]
MIAGASGLITKGPTFLVGEATTPTPFGRGAEGVIPFDFHGIGILAEALGMAMSKHGGGGWSRDDLEAIGRGVGKTIMISLDAKMDGAKVAELVTRHGDRRRMVMAGR